MGLSPINLQLFAAGQNVLVRCSYDHYSYLKENNQLSNNSLYFVSMIPPNDTNNNINDFLFLGSKLIGNSGVIFIEAENGIANINNSSVQILNNGAISLTAPTDLTSAITGIPGQVLFIVNHSIVDNKDQYNTFLFIWKESSTNDGSWINANLTYTLDVEGIAVTSVNGQTGDVVLTANDFNAYTKTEVDTLLGGKADKINVTSADVGKFARVNSQGQWVAEEVPNANGVNF